MSAVNVTCSVCIDTVVFVVVVVVVWLSVVSVPMTRLWAANEPVGLYPIGSAFTSFWLLVVMQFY